MPRRAATPAQREAAAHRRTLAKALAAKIRAMSPDELNRYVEAAPVVTIEGRQLSIKNQAMIMMQLDNPTVVGGFRQWKQAGRSVQKGQHGAMILYPRTRSQADVDTDDQQKDAVTFGTATVFDVSQTAEIQNAQAAD
uniref:N-terminal domain-containing protein n=1 Tax=viral metagenome TaxID=1070528 RepID=A0A6M3L4X3_9ZZZZ